MAPARTTPRSGSEGTTDGAQALAWLAGRLRWERTLRDLAERATAAGGPVRLAPPASEPAAGDPGERAGDGARAA
jgi:hypothetical protein